jgi:hypothetical protein
VHPKDAIKKIIIIQLPNSRAIILPSPLQTDVRCQMTENRCRITENRFQKAEDRGQKTDV